MLSYAPLGLQWYLLKRNLELRRHPPQYQLRHDRTTSYHWSSKFVYAPGITTRTRSKKLPVTKGIATGSKDATSSLYTVCLGPTTEEWHKQMEMWSISDSWCIVFQPLFG